MVRFFLPRRAPSRSRSTAVAAGVAVGARRDLAAVLGEHQISSTPNRFVAVDESTITCVGGQAPPRRKSTQSYESYWRV